MTKLYLSIFILFSLKVFGQTPKQKIKKIEGIWIAEEYLKSFDKTKSAVLSKKAFYYDEPVALRVNSKEINKNLLNIGYSRLHDHLLHPEVSQYLIYNNDTITEQATFKIDLSKKDSSGYYQTIKKYGSKSYITWNKKGNSLIYYRPENNDSKSKTIIYKKVKSNFNSKYPYPNPLYYYTRIKTVIGKYKLKDGTGKLLSKKLIIKENGLIKGYQLFNNFTAYFSTDVYCGPPSKDDVLIFIADVLNDDSDSFSFTYKNNKLGNIELYKRVWTTIDGKETLKLELKYVLEKN